MKKIIILIIAIVLVAVTVISYNIYYYNKTHEEAQKINNDYESFYNVEILGTDLASLINKIDDSNAKNNVQKDENGKYIENDTNSIKLEVKFSELNQNIKAETIQKEGINQFVQNFGAVKFKCTKIEYHEKTHKIKYMYFEQI